MQGLVACRVCVCVFFLVRSAQGYITKWLRDISNASVTYSSCVGGSAQIDCLMEGGREGGRVGEREGLPDGLQPLSDTGDAGISGCLVAVYDYESCSHAT